MTRQAPVRIRVICGTCWPQPHISMVLPLWKRGKCTAVTGREYHFVTFLRAFVERAQRDRAFCSQCGTKVYCMPAGESECRSWSFEAMPSLPFSSSQHPCLASCHPSQTNQSISPLGPAKRAIKRYNDAINFHDLSSKMPRPYLVNPWARAGRSPTFLRSCYYESGTSARPLNPAHQDAARCGSAQPPSHHRPAHS